MAIKFDEKTGQVFIRNYDQGVIETLGGFIDLYTNGSFGGSSDVPASNPALKSGGCKKMYFINVPGVTPQNVPVVFNKPFQALNAYMLPMFLITRLDGTPALERWHSVGQNQYRIGVPGTEETVILANGDTVSGYGEYEELVQAFPFDLPYQINVLARYEHQAIPMLKRVLSVYKPYSKLLIKDSLCSTRSYTVFNENGFSDISEIIDINDRMKAYSIEIRIEGELDLSDPEINPSALEIIATTSQF